MDPPEVLARIHDGLPVVTNLARHLQRELGALTVEELESYGREALVVAARSFDDGRGIPFKAWATLRARGAMIDGVRSSGNLPRRVYKRIRAMEAAGEVQEGFLDELAFGSHALTAEAADDRLSQHLAAMATAMAVGMLKNLSPDDEGPVDSAPSPEEQLARQQLMIHVQEAVAELPDAERHLVERHYFAEVTIDEAAREIGLSKSWGSRLHARAMEAVARALKRARVLP